MPLAEPQLDDLDFQQLVDSAKRLISIYCPEWTDHNVSDPGVTLIELFASMVEMLTYRVNRLPEKVYVAFLNLIGARLAPARAATADVTFYLSGLAQRQLEVVAGKAQQDNLTLKADTEISTLRTETSPPIVFSTTSDLVIRSARLLRVVRSIEDSRRGTLWDELPTNIHGTLTGEKLVFGMAETRPQSDNGLYLELADDYSNHVLAIIADCERASGYGAELDDPPWVWEVSASESGSNEWRPCEVEFDGTGGFNRNGENEIILRLPKMEPSMLAGPPGKRVPSFWLRCRLTNEQSPQSDTSGAQTNHGYWASPSVKRIRVVSRGGTVEARHAIVINDEVVGISEGIPGQTFRLRHGSLLPRDAEREHLTLKRPKQNDEVWHEVADFARSGLSDRHYTLDADGTLRFGPTLRQPDGTFRAFGLVPPKGAELHMGRYRYGGGIDGNLREGALTITRSADPRIARMTNWRAAIGGRDAQRLEDAQLRAADYLNMRTRAVTADDFQYFVEQQPEVERVVCRTPNDPGAQAANGIRIVVLPRLRTTLPNGAFPNELAIQKTDPLLSQLKQRLQPRTVLGTAFQVVPPQYLWVRIDASIQAVKGYTSDDVKKSAESALYHYINPYTGGPDGKGWPFGRQLTEWEITGLLQRLPGVAAVSQVLLRATDGQGLSLREPELVISLDPDGVLCSATHIVACSAQAPNQPNV